MTDEEILAKLREEHPIPPGFVRAVKFSPEKNEVTYRDLPTFQVPQEIHDAIPTRSYKPDGWECPIDHEGCTENCGAYGCGN